MSGDLDTKAKLDLYRLVINRYKDLINQNESRSISEIRQKVSPYDDFIRKKKDALLVDIVPYIRDKYFFGAAQKAIAYVREISVCEFAFNFWMNFEEMDRLKLSTSLDKAIMLAALLRAMESGDVRVTVTKKGKSYVKFMWKDETYLFVPESGSLLAGDDVKKLFDIDPVAYSFNDLVYENYADE
ncbi:hypothetical protein KKF81_03365 [Candidatus Micrarchaeota archaeon]|nr:hypothetical protein [Candidatus Micrarchaeota archaeon]MBU1886866.1 hypothetical protein [Candidatus Micrarchaeota archaeon]